MNTAKKPIPEQNPESYSPKSRPIILNVAEELAMNVHKETFVEQITEFCSIVDREETKIIGIQLQLTYEGGGYGSFAHEYSNFNDYFFAKKVISEGDIALLAKTLGADIKEFQIISARYDVQGDGNHKVVVGIEVDSFENLPEYLPENMTTLTVPACRYAKMLINEKKHEDRKGYDERMHADEYFVNGFRNDTKYVYNNASYPLNTFDETGDILTKYEPIKTPKNDTERFDSFRFKTVILPEMKIACCVTPPDSEDFVIFKYFEVEQKVFSTNAAKYYLHDYYGFPTNSNIEGKINSCFGTRVSAFDEIPDCVEKLTLPGGIYLHITQIEFNGDNPSMPYDIAFNHLEELFLNDSPKYERDWSRHVIARFRQANCASVFVPLLLKKQ